MDIPIYMGVTDMHNLLRNDNDNDMSFQNHTDLTACFTGHRPEKFLDAPLHSDEVTLRSVKTLLTMLTADAYSRGTRYFITGMARGIDLWAGEILLYMKRFLPNLHIIAALPYPGHENTFHGKDAELLYAVGDAADAVICTSDAYNKWCFLKRNDYMLKYSSLLLGVIHKDESGTSYTINKAAEKGISSRIVDVKEYRRMIPFLDRCPEAYMMITAAQRYAFWEKNPRILYQCGLLKETLHEDFYGSFFS